MTTSTDETTPVQPEETVLTRSQSIQQAVAYRVVDLFPSTRDAVIAKRAQIEADAQALLLSQAIDKLDDLYKNLRKIDRPDQVLLDRAGKQVGPGTYSADRTKEIKKLEEQIAKGESALETAWGDPAALTVDKLPKFDKLKEFLK